MAVQSISYNRPPLYPKQESCFFGPERVAVTVGSTKSGKTVGLLVWFIEQGLLNPHPEGEHWWLAPSHDQAKMAYDKAKSFLPASIVRSTHESDKRITLVSGGRLRFTTSDDANKLYGHAIYSVAVDEASRCKEETMALIESVTTATEGPIRLIGNAISSQNWHYQLWLAGLGDKDPDYRSYSLNCHDAIAAGTVASGRIESIRNSPLMSEQMFNALYLNIVPDTSCPFGLDNIVACTKERSELPTVCWGVDLGKSQSWTVVIGLDEWGRWTEVYRFQDNWTVVVDRIQQIVGSAPVLVDSTGVGDPVLEHLIRAGIKAEGFKFTEVSRQQLLEGLAGGFQRGQIRVPEIVANEARTFVTEPTKTGWRYQQARGHDDCVMAVALAWNKYQRLSRHTFIDAWEAEFMDRAS